MTVNTDTMLIKHLFLQFSQAVTEITYNENMFLYFSSYAIYLYLIVTNITITWSNQTSMKYAFFVHKSAHNADTKKHVLGICSSLHFQYSSDIKG